MDGGRVAPRWPPDWDVAREPPPPGFEECALETPRALRVRGRRPASSGGRSRALRTGGAAGYEALAPPRVRFSAPEPRLRSRDRARSIGRNRTLSPKHIMPVITGIEIASARLRGVQDESPSSRPRGTRNFACGAERVCVLHTIGPWARPGPRGRGAPIPSPLCPYYPHPGRRVGPHLPLVGRCASDSYILRPPDRGRYGRPIRAEPPARAGWRVFAFSLPPRAITARRGVSGAGSSDSSADGGLPLACSVRPPPPAPVTTR
jgi:hypothetical protein